MSVEATGGREGAAGVVEPTNASSSSSSSSSKNAEEILFDKFLEAATSEMPTQELKDQVSSSAPSVCLSVLLCGDKTNPNRQSF